MAAQSGLVQSPVLVGRDEYLALADRRLAEVAAGNGQLLLVAGEAGIGKTRLLGAIVRRAQRLGFTVVKGAAFPGDAEVSGSLLLDLTSDLGPAGPVMAARLRDPGTQGDPHRQRRLLVQDLADQLLGLTIGFPLLLVLEDLHWADALSLEVIGRLAPRLSPRPMLIAGAFRSDELHPRRPVRQWRGRLMTQRLAEEVRLPRLDRAQTATMTSVLLGKPASQDVVAGIFDRSDGIPLHVEELLAASTGNGPHEPPVPQTLADAVLARAHALSAEVPEIDEILAAAAVIGRSFDFDLLAAVAELEQSLVDSCLRRLRESFLIVPSANDAGFDFRHALIREALYLDISLPLRRKLHERAGRIAAERGYPDAFVSVHFEQARLTELAFEYSMRAAAAATAHSAHREALQLFRRALRNVPAGLAVREKAGLLSATGDAAAAVDDNTAAMEVFQQAFDLWRQAGDPVAAAGVVPRLTAVAHLLGEGLPGRLRRLESALDSVRETPRAQAQLLAAMAAAYMLDRRLDEAIDFSQRSRQLSEASGEVRSGLNTDATLGSVLVFAGRQDEGWTLLEHEIAQAELAHQEAEAARGYRMLGSCASVLVEYERAEHWLRRGIAYAERTELWNDRHYMAAHLAHVHWARGEWQAAQRHAEQALADGEGGITTRITALYVLGYLAMGRADRVLGETFLTEAFDLGRGMSELQRISPPLWGLAECALARGDYGKAMALADSGYQFSQEVADAAYLFPFLLTGLRAHLKAGDAGEWLARNEALLTMRAIPGTRAALDHAQGLMSLEQGEYVAAQKFLERAESEWRQRKRFWEGTWVLLDLAECAIRLRRRPQAIALVQRAREAASGAGAATIVAAADALVAGSGQPWHPLTAREFQIAQLVAAGLTNRQIAAQLVLSPKTVAAHIEHILAKLGAARRTEIASWAAAR